METLAQGDAKAEKRVQVSLLRAGRPDRGGPTTPRFAKARKVHDAAVCPSGARASRFLPCLPACLA